MRTGMIASVFGVLLLLCAPLLPSAWWLLVTPCLVYLLSCYRSRPIQLIGAIALGLLWALAWLQLFAPLPLASELEGEVVEVVGAIASLPRLEGRRGRFDFDVEQTLLRGEVVAGPRRIRLNWYRPHPEIGVGERWRLQVKLRRPRGLANPAGFDYRQWLYQQRIEASGYVRRGSEARRLDAEGNYPLQRLRALLGDALTRSLEGQPLSGVITALVIGERSAITAGQWQVVTATGTNHLLAISGLHIGMVAGLAYLVSGWLWRRSARLPLWLATPKLAALVAIAAAAGYAALAGFSIPTQRALIMIAVVMAGQLGDRRLSPSLSLPLALLAVTLYDPLALLGVGFWLSFSAVAVILFGMQGRLGCHGRIWQWGRVQWLVVVGLLPLLMLLFQQFSLTAPLVNLIAVPWIGGVVLPVALLGGVLSPLLPSIATPILLFAESLLQLIWWLLAWVAAAVPPYSVATPPLPLALLGGVGVVWLLMPRGWPLRIVGAVPIVVMLFYRPQLPEGAVRFTLLDVGQGLAVVVETRHHTLVYDSGPRFSDSFDTGSAVVVPYLRSRGVNRVDTLVVSHADNDHSGGAQAILSQLTVSRLLTGAPHRFVDQQPLACMAGQQWQWDGVRFEVLHPAEAVTGEADYRGNNSVCVIRVASRFGSLLLTGDIERQAEAELLGRYGDQLVSDWLIAPHHGSRTSSTQPFITAVAPTRVLFSSGYKNPFGFPDSEVVERYRELGALSYDTASSGAITVTLSQQGSLVEEQRLRWRRLWK